MNQKFNNPWQEDNEDIPKQPIKENLPKGLLIFILIIGIGLWLSTGFYTIAPDEQGIVIRFGKYNRTSNPGLNYKIPDPIEKIIKISVTRINKDTIGLKNDTEISEESQMLTGDENIMDLHFFVQWRINDAYKYIFNIKDDDQESTLRSAAASAMREVIGIMKLYEALSEQRQGIEKQAKNILQKILDSYNSGIEVLTVGILYSYVPGEVKDAYRDVQAAKADRERSINQGYTYKNSVIPEARAQAFTIIEQAKASEASIIANAQGQAQQFQAIYDKYKVSIEVTKKRMYLDAIEEIFKGTTNVLTGNSVTQLMSLNDLIHKKDNDKK